MRSDPLFEAFDAGWVLLIAAAACALFYAFIWLVDRTEPFDFDDEPVEHDTSGDRPSLEDDARRSPF